MNSPGYPDGMAIFARPIQPRCLECHSTRFEAVTEAPDNYRYRREGYLLGVTCERCHGPGGDHVDHHREHPQDEDARHIVHPGLLPRERLLNVCAQCHAGGGRPLQPAFSFRPGVPLADYLALEGSEASARRGVHSNNQLPRLAESRCFSESPSMSCVTCHNPHRHEHGDVALFSQRCQKCHEVQDCAVEPRLGDRIGSQCVECHMARVDDHPTRIQSSSGSAAPLIRDHFIRARIDDPEVERLLEELAGQ